MKKIFCYILSVMLILSVLTVTALATESVAVEVTESIAESITESITESIEDSAIESITETITINEEAASEIVSIVEGSSSKAQAILDIAERLGVTYEEAEGVLNAMLAAGDKYLGENELWIGFKRDVQENLQFWVIVIVCALAALSIAGIVVVQLTKTNPTMRRAMIGTQDTVKICNEIQTANSQTLANIEKSFAEVAKNEAIYQKLLQEKEETIIKLEEAIKELEIKAAKEKKNMVLAESYNLQILKLICSRTALPISDRAAIDLWYTRAMESLKDELSPEDIAKIDNIAAVIEKGDGNGDT